MILYLNLKYPYYENSRLIMLLFSSNNIFSQENNEHELLTSKSLVGVWNQVIPNKTGNQMFRTGDFKFINPDGMFYTMIINPGNPTSITMYGNYTVTSDNTFSEYIKKGVVSHKVFIYTLPHILI